jgi:hypothetical protein
MATAKIITYTTLSDFEAVAKRIKTATGNVFALMQSATVAALEHIEKHGNVCMLEPLADAAKYFKSKSLSDKWQAYVLAHSWFVYNPRELKGKALKDANFASLYVKDRARKMDLDGARATSWHEFELPSASGNDKPVKAGDAVSAFVKRLQKLIDADKLTDATGATIGMADLRAMIKAECESLKAKQKTVVDTGKAPADTDATNSPAKVKASKPRKTAIVTVLPTPVAPSKAA